MYLRFSTAFVLYSIILIGRSGKGALIPTLIYIVYIITEILTIYFEKLLRDTENDSRRD